MWAIGVITYILLSGYPPFYVQENSSGIRTESNNEAALLRKIVSGDFEFIEATWRDVSPEAIDFIKKLMCQDPNERLTCEQALSHPWLNDRQNLEQRAAAHRHKGSCQEGSCQLSGHHHHEPWTLGQQVAFCISVLVILGSYSALISFVFNIGKPGAIVQEFMTNLKMEFAQIYGDVYQSVEDYCDYVYKCCLQKTFLA